MIEDSLFFGDSRYPIGFHKQKLWLHRATMKQFEQSLQTQNIPLDYIEYRENSAPLKDYLSGLADSSQTILVADVHDFVLKKKEEYKLALMGSLLLFKHLMQELPPPP